MNWFLEASRSGVEKAPDTYRFDIWSEGDYVYGHASGLRNRDNIASMCRRVLAAAIRYQVDCALVDTREFNGRISVYDAISIPISVLPALRRLGTLDRVALLDVERRRERGSRFEALTRKAGYNFRVFTDMAEAIQWLRAE